jgi:cytochrome c biogenesis protein CcdA
MKKAILWFLLLIFPLSAYCAAKPELTFFYSERCKKCLKLKEEIFPGLKEKYKDKIEWKELCIDNNQKNFALLLSLSVKLKNKVAFVPAVWVGSKLLVGVDEIEKDLVDNIEAALKSKPSFLDFAKIDLLSVFKNISLFTVIGAGLIDGVNPCAFAVIIFFVSFLALYGYRKREIIWIGSSYCAAVFITYLLLGLGFFGFLYSLTGFYILIRFFYYLIAAFCFFLAAMALYDYFRFKKTGESEDQILQLPKFLKKRINLVIGDHLRERKDTSIINLVISAFTVGFFVSLLEAACTGQVYLPTIVFILKNTSLRLKAISYLLLYNLMFILPLIVIFALSLIGFSSQRFNKYLKNNLANIKFLMFLLFLLLGLVILWLG